MTNQKIYILPKLNYGYRDLEPYISEEQLTLHHQKHHQAYINGANAIFEKLEKARKENVDIDLKTASRELSFHMGGHLLHSLFWDNLAPPTKSGGDNKPSDALRQLIETKFNNIEIFKKEFSQIAISVEGSGWAVLAVDGKSNRLIIAQIEKHNNYIAPDLKILLVLDVWEHAYYLDYKNDRAKFIEAFWQIINWEAVEKRM